MESTQLNNDTRGWIMCVVSGLACILGASIIWIDVLLCHLPGNKNFRIQDSNVFLACALSLSFGVMQFSALYSMLPEAKSNLEQSGYTDQTAGAILMGCFIGGFVGIQVISRLLHQFMPSHVVDCDHTHDKDEQRARSRKASSRRPRQPSSNSFKSTADQDDVDGDLAHSHDRSRSCEDDRATAAFESTPLLGNAHTERSSRSFVPKRLTTTQTMPARTVIKSRATTVDRRPSMAQVQQRVLSFVKDTKTDCDELGPCYGYTDPCGQECFKHLGNRSALNSLHGDLIRASTTNLPAGTDTGVAGHGQVIDAESVIDRPTSPRYRGSSKATSRGPLDDVLDENEEECLEVAHPEGNSCSPAPEADHHHDHGHSHHGHGQGHSHDTDLSEGADVEAQHHHHVPTNAFLSLGLQTSIAIALHKFPEGFITYATNHANPTLGFSVFMALFVHNITEGFAMALPLYMALGSRLRALVWSSLLGGLSQPLGAAVAVAWLRLADRAHANPSPAGYACMFAITAGIMVSVALQLFVEAMSLDHNRNLCIFFGFLGMALLGVTSAVAAH